MHSAGDRPFLCYFGHHKAGSTWITDIMRDLAALLEVRICVANTPSLFASSGLRSWSLDQGADFACFTNASYEHVPEDMHRGFHVIRDPRDIVISAYYSHRYSHVEDPTFPQLIRLRETLSRLNIDEGLSLEIRALRTVFDAMGSWNYDDDRILEARFEDLVLDPTGGVRRIVEFLGWFADHDLDPRRVGEIVEKHTFQKKSGGRERGQVDHHSHYRRGEPGEWREVFTEQHHKQFADAYPGLVSDLGYAVHPTPTSR